MEKNLLSINPLCFILGVVILGTAHASPQNLTPLVNCWVEGHGSYVTVMVEPKTHSIEVEVSTDADPEERPFEYYTLTELHQRGDLVSGTRKAKVIQDAVAAAEFQKFGSDVVLKASRTVDSASDPEVINLNFNTRTGSHFYVHSDGYVEEMRCKKVVK